MKTNEKTAPILAEKDRNAVSLELMNRMKLHGMAEAFTESLSSTFAEAATPDSFLNCCFPVNGTTARKRPYKGSYAWPRSATRPIRKR